VCAARQTWRWVRSIGADHVIDYTRDDFTQSGERYDFILDNISNRSLSDLQRALTARGMLVPNGGQFPESLVLERGAPDQGDGVVPFRQPAVGPICGGARSTRILTAIKELIEAGKVTPVIDRTYP